MHPFDELLIISLDPNCFSDWDIKDSWCTFVQEIGNSGNLCYLLATHPKHSQQIALSLPITVTKCYPRWLNWSPHFSFLQKCYRSTNDPSAITFFLQWHPLHPTLYADSGRDIWASSTHLLLKVWVLLPICTTLKRCWSIIWLHRQKDLSWQTYLSCQNKNNKKWLDIWTRLN